MPAVEEGWSEMEAILVWCKNNKEKFGQDVN